MTSCCGRLSRLHRPWLAAGSVSEGAPNEGLQQTKPAITPNRAVFAAKPWCSADLANEREIREA